MKIRTITNDFKSTPIVIELSFDTVSDLLDLNREKYDCESNGCKSAILDNIYTEVIKKPDEE